MTYMTETDTFEGEITRWPEDDDPETLIGGDMGGDDV
jgi:hypothetical protein